MDIFPGKRGCRLCISSQVPWIIIAPEAGKAYVIQAEGGDKFMPGRMHY